MEACIWNDWGIHSTQFRWHTLPDPSPAPHEVVIEVQYTALGLADRLLVEGKWLASPPLPLIPGREVSGIVYAVGVQAGNWEIGEPVCAWLPHGGLADKVALPAAQVMRISTRQSLAEAAAYNGALITANIALTHRARLLAGETLLIHGATSSLGMAGIALGLHLGAKIIASVGIADKIPLLGLPHQVAVLEGSQADFAERVREISGGKGVNVVLDIMGGAHFDILLRLLAPESRWVMLGWAGSKIPHIAANRLWYRNATLHVLNREHYLRRQPAVVVRAISGVQQYLRQSQAWQLPTPKIFQAKQLAEALAYLSERKPLGKVLIAVK